MKIPVGILGATGVVGQQYLARLMDHPYFEITFLAASSESAGKSYEEAVSGRWHLSDPIPSHIGKMKVFSLENMSQANDCCRIVFSAVSTEAAHQFEERYAEYGLIVVSNASAHRKTPDVPLIIPEVNAHHLEMIPIQQKNRGWKRGFIIVKPNCSLQSYMIPLHPLHHHFGVRKVMVGTLQAMSGAGYPGIPSLVMADNVIPYIPGEEEKSENEPLKIWGKIEGNQIVATPDIAISAHCHRVPVTDGHLASVSVAFENKPTHEEILALWGNFTGLKLPSAPPRPILYREEGDRPQPRLDRHAGQGMAVTVGRLRSCPLFDYRFTALSHNTIRGAAGGGILNAELLVHGGWV